MIALLTPYPRGLGATYAVRYAARLFYARERTLPDLALFSPQDEPPIYQVDGIRVSTDATVQPGHVRVGITTGDQDE